MAKDHLNDEQTTLNLEDLLVDESNDVVSEYLSISIENLGEGAKVSVTTVEAEPATYSSTLTGITLTDLHCLVDVPTDV
tara:strand:+ start:26100 stop:26336 length:237 start_codon:yes stop_codon:yes gene_type:complete